MVSSMVKDWLQVLGHRIPVCLLQLFNLLLSVLCYLHMLGHKALHEPENVTFQHSLVAVFQC